MILARREPRWIRRQGAKMIYDSVKTTRVTHSNSALHLNAASHTVALHEARIISLWSWESKTSEMVAIWWKDWNECIIPQKHDKYGMRAVLPQTSMVLMEVLPPKHWVNSVQLLLHGWALKHQQNLEQFSYGNTDCVSCMILDMDNLHHKSQVSTALQCTRELENGYQRGAKTQNFLLDASHVSSRNMVSSFFLNGNSVGLLRASSTSLRWKNLL